MKLSAECVRSLPDFFKTIPDPRREQGRRHRLTTVLAIAAGAVLCGMRGYQAISDWADSLGQKARERFGCRRHKGSYIVFRVFSSSVIFSSVSTPYTWITPSLSGTTFMGNKTKVWLSMGKRCAMPLMKTAVESIS